MAWSASRHFVGKIIKFAAACLVTGAVAGTRLPAANGRVDIDRIELQPVAATTCSFGRDDRRAAAEKGIEHDSAAGRTIEDRVGNHRHRFDRRVKLQEVALSAAAGKGIDTRIPPDIAAAAAEPAELDVVVVHPVPVLEHQHKLVPAAVQRAHSGIVLDPDAEILQLAIGLAPSGQQLAEMAPIHADEVMDPSAVKAARLPQTWARKAVNSALS